MIIDLEEKTSPLDRARYEVSYTYTKYKEKIQRAIVWKLPRWMIYWATIRATAYATTGRYSNTLVPELKAIEVIERFKIN